MRLLATATAGLVAAVLAPLLLIGVAVGGAAVTTATRHAHTAAGVDPTTIPPLAAELLPYIVELTATRCPELPPLWVIAHVDAESAWDPAAFSTDRNGGAAGLYQLNQANWTTAGGQAWTTTPPATDADILQPARHLDIAIPWICANLRRAADHLATTSATTDPLDGMLVCHIAGCGRVTDSATGVPRAGEAGCDRSCADLVSRYIARVHANLGRFALPGAPAVGDLPPAQPRTGPGRGCTEDDPTTNGCLTPATRHAVDEVYRVFGQPAPAAPIRAATCWDEHAWNPSSDHPRGRACDFFPTGAGRFPAGQELADGWRLAEWLRANATTLRVSNIIWQGRIWRPGDADNNSWGRPYTGGGVYDPTDATGGHYDHVHLSIAS
ncbi:transglycosylase SLT domain-containing protein [Pseudonocardia lacus]|uniref:transglycosylase SLT domain-containing protein n=1 Tax=Pseudonocardia lacus TaxID=2835865 RepID=UPI001BDCFC58|nr:transglycosylase SLT domain-containing protein [Pseudonocardia lacus]